MPATLNFLDTYVLSAITEEIVPRKGFFKDRYFPTGAGDIFAADKVLTEYRKGDRKMAAFVSQRVGDIPIARRGYAIHEYQPAFIAPSRLLTLDELNKRGFGEALYSTSTPAQRAAALLRDDLTDMERRIALREEWMAAQVMINNACTMQTYVDAATQGETEYVQFYDSTSDHTYTIAPGYEWDTSNGDMRGDIIAMCRMLTKRGLPAQDLILGSDTADTLLKDTELREMLKTYSGVAVGSINETLTGYEGVVFMGQLNIGGYRLNVFCVDETYVNDSNQEATMFPAKAAMVTAPGCGHFMYGQITQIDYGSADYTTHVAKRVPKLVVDQPNDIRKLRLATRPLAAPKNYCPYIYAANANS
jgi:hypothetical protein